MNRFIFALALTPALFATGSFAQTVSDDVTKELWCGTALTIAFAAAPSDATSEQLSEAQGYIDAGNRLIDEAVQAHLAAGFTQDQVTKAKSDLVAEITPIVTTGDGSNAKYSFEECVALTQVGASGEQVDPGASAPAASDLGTTDIGSSDAGSASGAYGISGSDAGASSSAM